MTRRAGAVTVLVTCVTLVACGHNAPRVAIQRWPGPPTTTGITDPKSEPGLPADPLAPIEVKQRTQTRPRRSVGPPNASATTEPARRVGPLDLRVINWFPVGHAHEGTWLQFDRQVIASDFRRIAALRANAVRVIADVHAFRFPTPDPAVVGELRDVVSIASAHGLNVKLTLFDQLGACQTCGSYRDLAGSHAWFDAVFGAVAEQPNVRAVEIRNEMDPANGPSMEWGRDLISYARSKAHGVPVTVSAQDVAHFGGLVRELGPAHPDFWDVHFYGEPADAYADLAAAKALVGATPLVVGETGYSTSVTEPDAASGGVPKDPPAQEAYQDYYYRTVAAAASHVGLAPPAPWVLYDEGDPARCTGVQSCYGILRRDGTAKPVASTIGGVFAGSLPVQDFNGGFEQAADAFPAFWRTFGEQSATFGREVGRSHSGVASASIVNRSSSDACWRLRTVAAVVPDSKHTFSAWVQRERPGGTQYVTLNWLQSQGWKSAGRFYVPGSASGWTKVSEAVTAPADVTVAEFLVCDANNNGSVLFDDVELR